jgi:hypothetical protein
MHSETEEDTVQGYCLKCREKREMQDASEVTLKNGRAAIQGTCPVCGTKITVMGGKKAAETIAKSDKSDNIASNDSDGKVKKKAATKGKATAKA